MHPILFEWGPIRIGSYGVLLACAFASSIALLIRSFRRHGLATDLAWDISLMAMVGGLVGSKTLFLLEHFSDVLQRPGFYLLNTSGFSVLGGYALAVSLCWWRLRVAGAPFWYFADLAAPAMTIGYAVGRLGCIAAGDGCYGLPTHLPWGMCFPNGLVPTLWQQNPQLLKLHQELFPGEPVPIDIPVHPTPLYESISSWILLALLLRMQPGRPFVGVRIVFFLIWFGTSRFLVEFIRLNPKAWLGLTSDQWGSMAMVAAGLVLAVVLRIWPASGRPEESPPQSPPPTESSVQN